MKNIILTIILSMTLFIPAFAQDKNGAPVVTEPPVQVEHIKNLIETLESETARKDLISSLQILLEQQSGASKDAPATFTEQFGIRGQISDWVNKYEAFLDQNTISPSLFHQGIGTFFTFIIGIGLFLGVRKIAKRIILTIDHFSEKLGLKLTRISFYTRVFQVLLRIIIFGMMIYTLSKIWSFEKLNAVFESVWMQSFLTSSITIFIVSIIGALIWEAIGIYLSYILKQADDKNHTRVKTLLPLIRNVVLSVFALLFALVIMSEIGLNVAPFLAGAGVIGLAIGFGAQSMVKDFLTGFTIVIEDIIRVGDVVKMADCTGVVEKITLRKVQLRDFGGVVYTIPFSQISTIQNMTKNFSYHVMEVGVGYSQNTDHVIDVLKTIDISLRADDNFSEYILEPIEIVGVERFDDNAVIIKARIKTLPNKQWDVGREFNRRMKMSFEEKGIEIPFPQRVITIRKEE